jgi:hypothetical protein
MIVALVRLPQGDCRAPRASLYCAVGNMLTTKMSPSCNMRPPHLTEHGPDC